MATNPLDKVKLSSAQLSTLASGGSITSGSDIYSADEEAIYMTPKVSLDTQLKAITGYDATKTQILKNVSGTLTWVDET